MTRRNSSYFVRLLTLSTLVTAVIAHQCSAATFQGDDEGAWGTILGRLVDEAGGPARAHVVLLQVPPGEEWVIDPIVCPGTPFFVAASFLPAVESVFAREDGRFEFEEVPPGTWRLGHESMGAYHFSVPLEVEANAVVDAGAISMATRSPAHWVRGWIRSDLGSHPGLRCQVHWWRPGHDGSLRLATIRPEPGGRFAIPLPVAGESISILVLQGEESYAFAEGVPVPADGVELLLCPLHSVALRLEDGHGREMAIHSAQVALVESSGRALDLGWISHSEPGSVRIPDGRFVIRILAAGVRGFTAGPFDAAEVGESLVVRVPDPAERRSAGQGDSSPTSRGPLHSMQSPDPWERALAMASSVSLGHHPGSWDAREFVEESRRRAAFSTDSSLEGRLTLGGSRGRPSRSVSPFASAATRPSRFRAGTRASRPCRDRWSRRFGSRSTPKAASCSVRRAQAATGCWCRPRSTRWRTGSSRMRGCWRSTSLRSERVSRRSGSETFRWADCGSVVTRATTAGCWSGTDQAA